MCTVLQEIWEKQLTEENLKKVDGLRPIAEELGCSMAQLALAWAASNPDVSTVITGASKPQQASQGQKQWYLTMVCSVRVCRRLCMGCICRQEEQGAPCAVRSAGQGQHEGDRLHKQDRQRARQD
jgi:hypothetical protein